MTFWEIFYNLCIQNGTKPNPVAKEIGLSSATCTQWKKGAVPSSSSVAKIAEYFGVSVNYLLGNSENTLSIDEKNLILKFRTLDDFGKEAIKNIAEHEQKRCISERSSKMSKGKRYMDIQSLDDEMRNYASKILLSVDETYNEIFCEAHDIAKIKYYLNLDSALIEEAKGFYEDNKKTLERNEIDCFFENCNTFLTSVKKLIVASDADSVSDAKAVCRTCFVRLIDSVKGTILEDSEALEQLTSDIERSNYASNRPEENKPMDWAVPPVDESKAVASAEVDTHTLDDPPDTEEHFVEIPVDEL